MTSDSMPCCDLWCMKPAEFEIIGDSGHFEDQTHACKDHVWEGLGTPFWLERQNQQWIVVPVVEQPEPAALKVDDE